MSLLFLNLISRLSKMQSDCRWWCLLSYFQAQPWSAIHMELFSSADDHLVYSINEQIKSVLCIHDWWSSSCRQMIYPVVFTTLEPKWAYSRDLIHWKFNRSNPWEDLQRMELCSSTSFSPFSMLSWKDSNLFKRQIFVIKWSTLFWRVFGKSLIHCSFL